MFTHARWGVWETNSSSIHQLVINCKQNLLSDKPVGGILIRGTEMSLDMPDILTSAQEKLDYLVHAIVQDTNIGIHDARIFKLIEILQKNGVEIVCDIPSFTKYTWSSIAEEVQKKLLNMLDNDPEKIEAFLFDPTCKLIVCHNEDYEILVKSDDPRYEGYDVCWDNV